MHHALSIVPGDAYVNVNGRVTCIFLSKECVNYGNMGYRYKFTFMMVLKDGRLLVNVWDGYRPGDCVLDVGWKKL
jgi:hypothetical protein